MPPADADDDVDQRLAARAERGGGPTGFAGGAGAEPPGNDWYESEPPFGRRLVVELQRVMRRARARWFIAVPLGLALTAAVVYRVAKKPPVRIAHVVIAVTESRIGGGRLPMPARELKDYVADALLPRRALEALIEEKDLFPLRKNPKFGMPYAVQELRDLIEITVYRNFFASFTYDVEEPGRSARIDITVTHSDRKLAFELAQRIGQIMVDTTTQMEVVQAAALEHQAKMIAANARESVETLERQQSEAQVALATAEARGDVGGAAAVRGRLRMLDKELAREQVKLAGIEQQLRSDVIYARAMASGLGFKMEIVAERAPQPEGERRYRLALVALVMFTLLMPVAAVMVGAFDPRVHDTDDVRRLGFASVGHLPGFAGDRIGSLRARGVKRRRAAEY